MTPSLPSAATMFRSFACVELLELGRCREPIVQRKSIHKPKYILVVGGVNDGSEVVNVVHRGKLTTRPRSFHTAGVT